MTRGELITELVQQAPALDAEVVAALVADLRADPSPLTQAIAAVVVGVGAREIDAGIALPPIAMAIATLDDTRSTEREREAARFEIETLLPMPSRPRVVAPDVRLEDVTRGPPRRT